MSPHSKKLAFTLFAAIAVMLLSCETDRSKNEQFDSITVNAQPLAGTLQSLTIQGTDTLVQAWAHGPARVNLLLAGDIVATGTSDGNGSFNLNLPANIAGSYLSALATLSGMVGGEVDYAPKSVRLLQGFSLMIKYSTGTDSSIIFPTWHAFQNGIEKKYNYLLFDEDGLFQGTTKTGIQYDWSFVRGWNLVENNFRHDTLISSKTIATAPSKANWTN